MDDLDRQLLNRIQSDFPLVARPFAEGTFTRPIGLLVRKGKYLDRASQAVLDAFKEAAGAED